METSTNNKRSPIFGHNKFHGVEDGVRLLNLNRTAELNQRIFARNIPTSPLQPHYSIRPVSTKYDMMSIIDRRAEPNVDIKRVPTHNVKALIPSFKDLIYNKFFLISG